jgi:hypothetical protein
MKCTERGGREKQQWVGYRGARDGRLSEVPAAPFDDLINRLDAVLSQRLAEIEAWKEDSARPTPLGYSSGRAAQVVRD